MKNLLLFFSMVLCHTVFSQITVTGTVKSSDNVPIPGASVLVSKSNTGSVTDENGQFSVQVSSLPAEITISFVGFETLTITATTQNVPSVMLLEAENTLKDVVIIGYGRQKEATKTGSIDQIKREDIVNTPSPNLQNMLVGKISGFTPIQRSGKPGAEGGVFYIRGVSTEVGTTSPLILVDDIEYDFSQFNAIDPNEVESITVLKDAAATAIYGIKGANGAVLVTTRRGTGGKPRVTFKSQVANQYQVQPLKPLDSYDAALLWNQSIANRNVFNTANTLPGGTPPNVIPPKFTQTDLDHYKNGTDPYGHPNVDWYNTLFKQSSLMATNNIDVSGGGDRVKYFVSLGHLIQNGALRNFTPPSYYEKDNINSNFYYKRYNFRSNIDIIATQSLSFRADVSGNLQEQNEPSGSGNPYNEIMYAFGGVLPWSYAITNPDGSYGYTNNALTGSIDGNANNIVARLALSGYNRNITNQFNINLAGVQKLDALTKGLSARVAVAYTNNNTSTRSMTRNAIPSFFYTPATGATPETYVPRDVNIFRLSPLSLGSSNGAYLARTTLQASLNYARGFGKHNVGGLLLFNRSSESVQTGNIETNMIPENFIGYTGRVNYNFMEKYLIELSGAYNGTSRFQEKYGFFPAVSIGYNIANESFFKNSLKFVSNLKLRASWGITGSNSIGGQYSYLYFDAFGRFIAPTTAPAQAQYGYNTYNFGLTNNPANGITETRLGNRDITWQTEQKRNIGTDFGFFKNKITGSVDVFDNTRSQILYVRQSVPTYYGLSGGILPPVNLGEVNNRGIDVELRHNGKAGKLGYNLTAIYSYAKNKILQWDEPPKRFPWLVRTGNQLGVEQLYTFDGFYTQAEADVARAEAIKAVTQSDLKRTVPVPTGVIPIAGMLKYKDLTGDGLIDLNDRAYQGFANIPNSTTSLGFGVNYKGFSANILFQGAWDYNLRLSSNAADIFRAAFQPIHQNSWTPTTAETATYPVLMQPIAPYSSADQASTFWSISTWYVRFRSFDIGYDFGKNVAQKMKAESVRLFLNASNIYTWSNIRKRYQIDPEAANASGATPYPQQRILNVGFNIVF
jgi:TonB-linked SusC/RagA family outer membrane protein